MDEWLDPQCAEIGMLLNHRRPRHTCHNFIKVKQALWTFVERMGVIRPKCCRTGFVPGCYLAKAQLRDAKYQRECVAEPILPL